MESLILLVLIHERDLEWQWQKEKERHVFVTQLTHMLQDARQGRELLPWDEGPMDFSSYPNHLSICHTILIRE